MAKPRVHEIAAELGIESKVALQTLREMGEFVKTASSSVEPPVARRLAEELQRRRAEAQQPAAAAKDADPGADAAAGAAAGAGSGAEAGAEAKGAADAKPAAPKPAARPKPAQIGRAHV